MLVYSTILLTDCSRYILLDFFIFSCFCISIFRFSYLLILSSLLSTHPSFHCLYWTGLRKGEVVALYKTDLQDHLLSVNRTLSKGGEIHTPKTVSSRREVRLNEATYKMLLDLADRPGKYLFDDDGMLSTTQIDRIFDRGTTAADLPKIRVHDLRHSHATNPINTGAKITAVSLRLWHAAYP